jgi:hypothetical protein
MLQSNLNPGIVDNSLDCLGIGSSLISSLLGLLCQVHKDKCAISFSRLGMTIKEPHASSQVSADPKAPVMAPEVEVAVATIAGAVLVESISEML